MKTYPEILRDLREDADKTQTQIAEVLGKDVRFFDGGAGTARQLRARLADAGLPPQRPRPRRRRLPRVEGLLP